MLSIWRHTVHIGTPLISGQKTFIGIYSQNCPEWVLTEQAAYCQSMVIVPLYDTLGPEACTFIINTSRSHMETFC